MGFSDNKTAKYPGALGDLLPVMDKLASSVFETSAKTINTGDETYTVPTSTPYAIRLRYVPKETRDGSGNPIGVAIAGMTEIAWSDTAAPSTAQFMVNYLNGEVKFSAASAGAAVSPAYQGVESRAWAEMLNEALRELKKVQEILGINIQGAYTTAKDRIIAVEGEVQTARAGKATLDERLDEIDAALAPMAGASPTRQEPSAETGVLGTAQIELDFDLYMDTDTVIAANVKLKDSQNVDYPLTLSYNKTNRRISGTHTALVDEVYTVYTLSGLRDALGRSVTPVSWSYGVGAAVANDTPDVTNLQVLNPSLNGFTAKGTITDLEGDTITRVDVRYGMVNNPEDPGNLTVQLTGADIAAFQSANGKTLNLSLVADDWFSWARAAALLPSGGTQVGDWSTVFGFVVVANARPVVSGLQTLAQSTAGFTAKGTITDNESDAITQLDIVWSQNGSADPETLFAGSTKVSYTQSADIDAFKAAGGKAVTATLAAGDWFWWAKARDAGGAGSWVRIGSAFNVSSALRFKKKLGFNTTVTGANITVSQAEFPVLVHINASSWTQQERDWFFGAWNVDGKRIRFYDLDGTTLLPYVVVAYNNTTKEAIYRTKPATVDANSTADGIWCYYGEEQAWIGSDQEAANKTAVWKSAFKMALPLGDNFWSANSPHALDATANANNGVNTGTTDVAGSVGRGRYFDGQTTTKIALADASNLLNVQTGSFALLMTAKIANTAPQSCLFRGVGASSTMLSVYVTSPDGKALFQLRDANTPTANLVSFSSNAAVNNDTLRRIGLVKDGATARIYIDGNEDNSASAAALLTVALTGTKWIGLLGDVGSSPHTGTIDEVQWLAEAPSPSWMKLDYENQRTANGFIGGGWLSWSASEAS